MIQNHTPLPNPKPTHSIKKILLFPSQPELMGVCGIKC
uniref:Uncharacterized protein n=1 Tax=Ciona intestinalis TaxID=7719 RepID=H2XVQ4_CIOIN